MFNAQLRTINVMAKLGSDLSTKSTEKAPILVLTAQAHSKTGILR
jgi:hypothetical protein